MKKRYQIFVSSTFLDLKEERNEVIKALLELDCIPCAMEFFPSSDLEQEMFIRELMKTCDYYIVIIGGKYGTETSNGVSYTQLEYSIAKELQIPEIAFIHEDINIMRYGNVEKDPIKFEKLEQFISILKTRLYKPWRQAEDLGAKVSRSLTQLINSKPRTGWIRADAKTEEHLLLIEEINSLNNKINELRIKAGNSADVYKNFDDAWTRKIEDTLRLHLQECSSEADILKIRLMGLCLHKSFPALASFLTNNEIEGTRIEIKLSVLDPKCDSWKLLNKRWDMLQPIFEEDLQNLIDKLKSNKQIDVSIKLYKYNHMPNWHGMLINHEDLFLGTCMWDSGNYLTAGENIYEHLKIGTSYLQNQLIKLYTRWFNYGRFNGNTAPEKELLYDSRYINTEATV